jgi:hypothetical protein
MSANSALYRLFYRDLFFSFVVLTMSLQPAFVFHSEVSVWFGVALSLSSVAWRKTGLAMAASFRSPQGLHILSQG